MGGWSLYHKHPTQAFLRRCLYTSGATSPTRLHATPARSATPPREYMSLHTHKDAHVWVCTRPLLPQAGRWRSGRKPARVTFARRKPLTS